MSAEVIPSESAPEELPPPPLVPRISISQHVLSREEIIDTLGLWTLVRQQASQAPPAPPLSPSAPFLAAARAAKPHTW